MSAVYAQSSSEELIAQKPFVATVVEGVAVTKDSSGTPLAVTIPQSINTLLQVVNLRTMQRVLLAEQRTDGQQTAGRAYVTLPNRHVLVATSTGFLFDVNPDKLSATEQTVPGEKPLAWYHAVLAANGRVYLAGEGETGYRLYEYIVANSSLRDVAALPEVSSGLAYSNGAVYVGSRAPKASVSAVDVQSGTVRQLTLTGLASDATSAQVEAIYDNLLYVSINASRPVTLIYDLQKGVVVDQQTAFGAVTGSQPSTRSSVQPVPVQSPNAPAPATVPQLPAGQTPPSAPAQPNPTESAGQPSGTSLNPQPAPAPTPTSPSTPTQTPPPHAPATTPQTTQTPPAAAQTLATNTPHSAPTASTTPAAPVQPAAVDLATPVYFGALSQYTPATKSVRSYGANAGLRPVGGNCWIDATRCVVYDHTGRLGVFSTVTRSLKLATPSPLVGGYQTVKALTIAPDDTLYAAAAATGAGVLRADRETVTQRTMLVPPAGTVQTMLSVGQTIVAGTGDGGLASYDAQRSSTAGTPEGFGRALKVGPGSVTALASTGSSAVFALSQTVPSSQAAIGVYDLAAQNLSLSPQVVLPDQTIASLAYRNGVVYGGGAVARDAKTSVGAALFAYNLQTRTVDAKLVAVPGARAITSVAVGSNGHVYGVADATLFEYDPLTKAVVQTKAFYLKGDSPGNVVFWQGKLRASVADKIYDVNLTNFDTTQIASGRNLAINSLGDSYYSRDGGLYRVRAKRQAIVPVAPSSTARSFDLTNIRLTAGVGSVTLLALLLMLPLAKLFQRRHAYTIRR